MERRGNGKRETERLERGRSRTEDKIDYRREAGTRTYVEGARAQSGDKTDRNTSTIHRAWGGFLFEHPPPRSSALLIRLNVATDLTRRTRDSLISVAIISVMQRRGVAREIIFLLACVFSPFSFGFRFSRGHWSVWKIVIHPSRCVFLFSIFTSARSLFNSADIIISRKSFHARTRMRHVHCDQGRRMTHRRIITTLPVNPV